MKNINEPSMTDVYALECIRYHVRRLVVRKLVQHDEVEDVCHDVYCDFLRRRHRYDPSRGGYSTFTSCAVRNLVASVARTRSEFRRRYSFSECCEATTSSRYSAEQFVSSTNDALDRQIAVRQALERLPDRLRSLAVALSTESLTEVSERTGKSRSSLYVQKAEIRAEFERLGLALPQILRTPERLT